MVARALRLSDATGPRFHRRGVVLDSPSIAAKELAAVRPSAGTRLGRLRAAGWRPYSPIRANQALNSR